MYLKIQSEPLKTKQSTKHYQRSNERLFSKDYVDFLDDAGWTLEKKFPSNNNYYSDLLEDTEWNSIETNSRSSIHYRRDLDAIS